MRLIAIAVALVLASCGSPEGFTIRGTVRDSETGKEISREGMYLHFFCDDIDHQVSLEDEDEPEFEVTMPKARVRIRAADGTSRYHLFETTVDVVGNELEFDISMVPTHYVLLKGRVLDGRTGAVIVAKPGIGSTPLFYLEVKGGFIAGMVGPQTNGTYEVRVPREVLTIQVVNTPLSPRTKTLDLTDFEGDVKKFDLIIE